MVVAARNAPLEAAARFWWPLGFLALVPASFALGGLWSFAPVAALPAALVLCDSRLGDDHGAGEADGRGWRLLPWTYIPLQIGVLAWAATTVAEPATSAAAAVGLTLSCALSAGVFGFLAAHEMVHSRRPGERLLGLVMLAVLLDTRFSISHLHGHHRNAATRADPATARRGESLYAFVPRSLAGQAAEAWRFETDRLRQTGAHPVSLKNRVLAYALVEAALVICAAAWSLRAGLFLLADAAVAMALLEGFNYVAHYGLERRLGAAGRPEPLQPRHSWTTARLASNAVLMNMGRHADHHRFAASPYQTLEVVAGAAELPCGYAGALLMALVPPLWRKVMDPLAARAMAAGEAPAEREKAAA